MLRQRREPGEPAPLSKEFFDAQMEVVIEERVPVYASGLGNPGPWMKRLRANNTKVMCVVGKVKHAVQVIQAGIDIVVAQGHDGGGHNSPIGTMALIPQVVDAVGDVPVLGAGGITDGRGIAAAMMLGAEGVWVGSAFLASNEAGIQDFQKQAIVDASRRRHGGLAQRHRQTGADHPQLVDRRVGARGQRSRCRCRIKARCRVRCSRRQRATSAAT